MDNNTCQEKNGVNHQGKKILQRTGKFAGMQEFRNYYFHEPFLMRIVVE